MKNRTLVLGALSAIFFPYPLFYYAKKLRQGIIVNVIGFLMMFVPPVIAALLQIDPDEIVLLSLIVVPTSVAFQIGYAFFVLLNWYKEKKKTCEEKSES